MTMPVPIIAATFLLTGLLGGCTTAAQRRSAENAAIQREAAQEVRRICALPPPERDAELARIRTESGIVVQCGRE